MLNTIGIVDVDHLTSVSRQINDLSLASRRIGGQSLLAWVVRRVTDAQRLDRVIVLCKDQAEYSVVSALAPPDVDVFVSTANDTLARLRKVVETFPCQALVRVLIGNAFVDPELIDRLVVTARENPDFDYITFCSSKSQMNLMAQLGLVAEWISTEAIRSADQLTESKSERQRGTGSIYSRPDLFKLRMMKLPEALDRSDFRLVVSGEEDWEHAQMIHDALGTECMEWQRIAGLLNQHPAITEEMAKLNAKEFESLT